MLKTFSANNVDLIRVPHVTVSDLGLHILWNSRHKCVNTYRLNVLVNFSYNSDPTAFFFIPNSINNDKSTRQLDKI